MAIKKYTLKTGEIRTPEEYRKIQEEIDRLHKISSAKGELGYKKTGVRKSKHKKPRNTKRRIYDLDRVARK